MKQRHGVLTRPLRAEKPGGALTSTQLHPISRAVDRSLAKHVSGIIPNIGAARQHPANRLPAFEEEGR